MTDRTTTDGTGPAEVARLLDVMAGSQTALTALAQAVRVMQDAQDAQARLASLPASDLRAGLLYRAQSRTAGRR